MIQFNVLSEIIFKSEQVLKISNDVLEMLYFCIGKKEGVFFWLIRHIYVCILNLKLYFERVEIFLWQFWHLCGCAGAGRGSSDCTSLCWTAWPGPGEAGGPACQEDTAARPQRPERERERAAVSATSTVSQCGVAERQTECHDHHRHSVTRPSLSRSHHTRRSLCHAWASEILVWRPGVAEVRGHHQWGQRTVPYTCEPVSSMWPPGLSTSHHILSWLTSVFRKEREERAGVGPWQWPAPCVPSLAVRNSQSIADSDTGHWTLARLIAVDTRWPSPAPCHHSPCTQRFKSP